MGNKKLNEIVQGLDNMKKFEQIASWCNDSTRDSNSLGLGLNPSGATIKARMDYVLSEIKALALEFKNRGITNDPSVLDYEDMLNYYSTVDYNKIR